MASWDKIYRNYKKGGDAWATLDGRIIPQFKHFLSKSDFIFKHALDIGCGTGNYLLYLANKEFKVDGIDSSPTAIEMARELFEKKNAGNIRVADMFKFRIAKNKYDLIISIEAIQHGFKKDIQNLINKIQSALICSGKVFITLPDFESSKKWNTFRKNKNLGNGTFAPLFGPEKGLPHSFYTKTEIQKLFAKFSDVRMHLYKRGRWVVQASK